MHDIWNPWHGCHKISPGCKNCYMFYLDKIHDNKKASNLVYKTNNMRYPLQRNKDGSYKIKAGEKLSAGDTITLYIPNVVTKYPDFTDGSYTIDDVQKFCDQYGVKLKIIYDSTSSYNAGTIFQQSRDKGYTVTEGTTFTITVAKEAEKSDSQVSDSDCDEEMQASGMC